MKKPLLIAFIAITVFYSGTAQDVNIPDPNFLAALIDEGVDTSGDDMIQVSEAEAVISLDISQSNIGSVNGIGAFINLEELDCSYNSLTNLDLSENVSLEILSCGWNSLTILDVSQNMLLEHLYCSSNSLTILDVSQNMALEKLYCRSNDLISLDVSQNVELKQLYCSNNSFTSLDVLQNLALQEFECSGNDLTTLDVSQNAALILLDCSYNFLTSLDVRHNAEMFILFCGANNLTHLDLSNNYSLAVLYLDFNNLILAICANVNNFDVIKNEVDRSNLNETIVSLFCGYGEFVKYQSRVRISEDLDCEGENYLAEFPASIVFEGDTMDYIFNSCIYLPVSGSEITILSTSPNEELLTVLDSIIVLDSLKLTQGADSSGIYSDTICGVVDTLTYDLSTTILSIEVPRPGFDVEYKLIYENKGTITKSGTVGLKFDNAFVTFVTADPMPDVIGVDSLTWTYSDLQAFERRENSFEFRLNSPMDNSPLNDGDIISYNSCMRPMDHDYDPSDNCFELNQTVRNAYDPNDKRCLQGGYLLPDNVGGWLTYMIRFENTGSAEAVNIRVTDVIDTLVFDIKTLTAIDASHAFHIEIHNENQVHFVFPDIYLPFDDANNDGYMTFRIKTRNDLSVGDTISNQASIYFDFNFPIITNEAITEVKESISFVVNSASSTIELDIQPNPATQTVNIFASSAIHQIDVTTLDGQLIRRSNVLRPSVSVALPLNEILSGLYLIAISTDQGLVVRKLVVE